MRRWLIVAVCMGFVFWSYSKGKAEASKSINMDIVTKGQFEPYFVGQAFQWIHGIASCCEWGTGEIKTTDGATHRKMNLRYLPSQTNPAAVADTFKNRTNGKYWVERSW